MKRLAAVIIIFAMLLPLCGCRKTKVTMKVKEYRTGYGIAGQDYSGYREYDVKNIKEGDVIVGGFWGEDFTVAGDATITVATHKEGEAASVTITKTMEAMATALSWNDAQQYASWNLDANVVVSTTASGNNGKYYTSNKSWRIYDKPVVITAGEGYKLVSVTFTYTKGAVTGAANGAVVTVDATSFSGAVSARTDITAISVTYIAA